MEPIAPSIGLAWSHEIEKLLQKHDSLVDYVEFPFEKLRASPELIARCPLPIILHCASMSVGGQIYPSQSTIESIRTTAQLTRTPWIGEHLAFTTAHRFDEEGNEVVNTEYTICPQLSEESLENSITNFMSLQRQFDREIIIENPPQYFFVPGSTLSQVAFIRRFSERTGGKLLLDLAHLYITARNTGREPLSLLDEYPIENIVEVHISGASDDSGVCWDNHGIAAPEAIFELLRVLLNRAKPRAITLEFNWHSQFSEAVLLTLINRVKEAN
ncbi:DUF692 family multinuclear iron-containing protein [Mesorhizobium sp. M0909]|uniref:multinuclear nonheme iron-dependent oxidase n=1 Tax=Mesorhizobium sp. M0909 TaxID=2957024 RepID=UPI003334F793